MRLLIIVFFVCVVEIFSQSHQDQFVISGYVTDAISGEVLPGATVVVDEIEAGASSNAYGFFSLSLPDGDYSITCAFLGYQPKQMNIRLNSDLRINPALEPVAQRLSEVEILGISREEQIRTPVMGVEKLDAATIQKMPVLFGETDPLKALQLLPGISATSEGSSGFTVRGGNPDQNLLLLDEAIVYNGGHLLGFFSVFNNDAIKEVRVYKGDIPASAGGRLSSLVDIRSRDGNMNNYSGVAGIGLISSRLTLEGPVVEDRSSFMVSGRRTYLDMFLPLASDDDVRDSRLYFYDLNMKLNYIAGENDRIFLSAYLGRDVFNNQLAGMDFGNRTLTLRWNRVFNPRLFSNLSVVSSRYDYYLGTSGEAFQTINWRSRLNDYSFRYGFTLYPRSGEQVDFGLQTIFHSIEPGHVSSPDEDATVSEFRVPRAHSLENACYLSHTRQLNSRLSLRYGVRVSLFQNIGKGQTYRFDEEFNVLDTLKYESREIYNSYPGLEPRMGFSWLISTRLSLKGSYAKTRQNIHLASNSVSSTPLDVWFTSTPNIRPQIGNQFSLGLFYFDVTHQWEHSLELFYKYSRNSIDFRDHANLLLNKVLEGEVRPGRSRARGMEWMTRYSDGRWDGWVAYTWSRSQRQSKWINDGNWYLSPYDNTHDISLVASYQFSERMNVSGNWVYFTGAPVTMPEGRFEFQGGVFPIYSRRNAQRMPDYHRMDLSFNLKGKPRPSGNWRGEWNFSVYNLYGRKNAWMINFITDDEQESYVRQAEMTYLFSVIPSITYTIRF